MDERELNLQVTPKTAYEISVALSELFDELPEEVENSALIFNVIVTEGEGLDYVLEIHAHIEECGISFLLAMGEMQSIPETLDEDVMEAFTEFLNSDAFELETIVDMIESFVNIEEE